jgi:hypothetical protein
MKAQIDRKNSYPGERKNVLLMNARGKNNKENVRANNTRFTYSPKLKTETQGNAALLLPLNCLIYK